jgi:hypothetical protein
MKEIKQLLKVRKEFQKRGPKEGTVAHVGAKLIPSGANGIQKIDQYLN